MALTLEEALKQPTRTFPVDVVVVEGCSDDSDPQRLPVLRSGSRIRILLTQMEPVFRCEAEEDHRTIFLPLGCSTKLELLQPDAVIDDKTFETVNDILQSPVRPSRVRVQSGYDGGATWDTIDVGEVLENLRFEKRENGDTALRATSISKQISSNHPELLKRPVYLSLKTAGTFTTTSAQDDRYVAMDLEEKWTRVPQRVRVHTDTCEPFKACIRKLEERKVAVCVHMQTEKYVTIPASSEIVVSVQKEYHASSRLSRSLHKWVNITALPRIDLNSVKDQSHPNDTVDQFAVLFSPTHDRCLNTDYLCHYETLVNYPALHQINSLPMRKIDSLPQSNLLSSHRDTGTKISQVSLLMETSTMDKSGSGYQEVEDDDVYEHPGHDDSGYAVPGRHGMGLQRKPPSGYQSLVGIAGIQASCSAEDSHYAKLEGSQPKTDTAYSKVGRPLEQLHLKMKLRERTQSDTGYAEVGEHIEQQHLRTKLHKVREHNQALQQYKNFLQSNLDYLTARNTESVKDLLCSLSCKDILSILENAGLRSYRQKFIDEKVDGLLIHRGGKDYLLNVGMRPAHACKFMAMFACRVPHWILRSLLLGGHY